MLDLKRLFDPYDRQARLYPALLTLLPAILLVLAVIPGLGTLGRAVIAIGVTSGVLYLLSDYARTAGKRLEPKLVREWGGWPTTIWLRHRDSHLPTRVKQRYHDFLAQRLGAEAVPTSGDERARPERADECYDACVIWLKEQCRGPAFALVEKENATYGFRRNLLGLKPIAIGICISVLLAPAAAALRTQRGFDLNMLSLRTLINGYSNMPAMLTAALVFALVMLIWLWFLTVRGSWLRDAGDQYARALLAGCDVIAIK
jgi:hypothetical protein